MLSFVTSALSDILSVCFRFHFLFKGSRVKMTDAAYLLDFLRAHGVPKIVKKRHSYLAYYGNKQPYTHILETGEVKTSIILKNGREFNIAYLNAPDIISLLRDEVSSYTS